MLTDIIQRLRQHFNSGHAENGTNYRLNGIIEVTRQDGMLSSLKFNGILTNTSANPTDNNYSKDYISENGAVPYAKEFALEHIARMEKILRYSLPNYKVEALNGSDLTITITGPSLQLAEELERIKRDFKESGSGQLEQYSI